MTDIIAIIDPKYYALLCKAVDYAKSQIINGASWYKATEYACFEFAVSICDIQERVPNTDDAIKMRKAQIELEELQAAQIDRQKDFLEFWGVQQ